MNSLRDSLSIPGGKVTMESFHTELYIHLILFSGIRVPNCKESVIKNKCFSFIYDVYVIITDTIVFLSLVSITTGMFLTDRTLIERCLCALGVMACLFSTFKVFYCLTYHESFSNIFKLWNNHFDDDPYLNDLKDEVIKQKRFVHKISFLIFSLVTPPATVWGLLPYLPVIQNLHGGKFTVIPAWFPFDITKSPNFELAVLFQTLGGIYVTSKNIAFDTIFYNLISRQTTQIKHLRSCLEKILSTIDVNNEGKIKIYNFKKNATYENFHDFNELQSQLQIWIKHHQHTIKISKTLNQLYSAPFTLLLLYAVLTICMDGFTLIAADIDDFQFLSLGAYVFGNLLLLFALCYMGDHLTYHWRHQLESGFGTNWFACPNHLLSSLKIIFIRCQTPLQLLGLGVYPISADTFLSIIKMAYSFITVLKKLVIKKHI